MKNLLRKCAPALVSVLAASAALSSVPLPAAAAATAPLARPFAEATGVRVPTGLQGQRAYDAWLGRRLDTTLLYAFETSHLLGITKDGGQASGRAVDGDHTAVITVGLVPKSLDDPLKTGTNINVTNIRRGLNGEFDQMYEDMARRLVERGLHQPWPDGRPKVVIRLGHEHNLLHTEWHSGGIEADWARLYRRVVTKMEAITGPQLTFEWNSSFTGAPADLAAAYPGDDIVDVIGVDFYDRQGYPDQNAFPAATGTGARTTAQRQASWDKLRNGNGDAATGQAGLQWFYDFAKTHNKAMGVSEWGLFAKERNGSWSGGGDNPYFITKVHEFFTGVANTGHLAYLLYFEANPTMEGSTTVTNTFHKLAPGDPYDPITVPTATTTGSRFPASARTYLELFGPGGSGAGSPATGGGTGGTTTYRFTDVAGNTHATAIAAISEAGITGGFADGTFRPDLPVTRGQMAAFLMRGFGLSAASSSFSDVAGNTHAGAIGAVSGAGIASGFADGTYRPDQPVTRGQMATFLMRSMGMDPVPSTAFADIGGNAHADAIGAVAGRGIASGFADGSYRPDQPVTRGQMATFLMRAKGL